MAWALGRTAVKLLPWETTHLSAFALSAKPGVTLDLTIETGDYSGFSRTFDTVGEFPWAADQLESG